jgi:hypothetical protein
MSALDRTTNNTAKRSPVGLLMPQTRSNKTLLVFMYASDAQNCASVENASPSSLSASETRAPHGN